MGNSQATIQEENQQSIDAVQATPIDNEQSLPIAHAVSNSESTPNPASDPERSSTGISMTLSSELSVYSSGSAIDTMVGINLLAATAPTDNDRAPVDCVVVSDVSGSMGGPKMTLLKETVKLLLDEFVAKDRVGLVTFDTNVSERFALQSMTPSSRQIAEEAVGTFRPGSSTNLSGGCFAGIQQLLKSEKEGHVRTVLLMTDGQANHGLRSEREILPVLTNMLKDTGISLHTFGYGSDHNADLLRNMSTAGNGSYYFVEGVDDIRNAFGDCLGGMLSVVAQNIELEIEAVNGATITKVHSKNAVTVEASRRYRVPFADLYGDEQRDVLVSVHLERAERAMKDETSVDAQVIRATLRYIDVLGAAPASGIGTIGLRRTDDKVDLKNQTMNPKLALQSTRIRVADTIESARSTAERGDLSRARSSILRVREELKSVQEQCQGAEEAEEMMTVFEDDLRECADGLVDRGAYQKVQSKMLNLSEGHRQQRCMESAVDFGSNAMRKNAYRTKAKSSKVSKWSPNLS